MKLSEHWTLAKETLERGQRSTIYCSIGSIAQDGTPNVTPIGTVFLRDNQTGYYFDHYTSALAENLDSNPNVCVMAVNAGRWFWLKSLWRGSFAAPPGVRLYGKAGRLRPATAEEIELIEARVRPTRFLKGSQLLWSGFTHVRDITFTSIRPITYPVMMNDLWGKADA
ncbi:TPA: pyridoxamine 5'-phosphate oxidase family protein [Pseudomonas aeruginosa]|uniref:pyridoxamine 5'-phosphate oxidase family protein n=1 Tax=Pseudomonas aeruginosa TaxID=287 RepID=UPI00093CC300|nr:pyridoxamine 5'-phosphate oxidase family protein [Pseudomonas aeruginosa]